MGRLTELKEDWLRHYSAHIINGIKLKIIAGHQSRARSGRVSSN